jgi:hypothetical protein
MVDGSSGVFTLDDSRVFDIFPGQSVKVPLSCYSKIHGDFHGMLKLLVRDPWQSMNMVIPLHVR